MRTFTTALILSLVLLPSAALSGQQPAPSARAGQKPTPTPTPAPATPAAAAPADDTRSLFEPTGASFKSAAASAAWKAIRRGGSGIGTCGTACCSPMPATNTSGPRRDSGSRSPPTTSAGAMGATSACSSVLGRFTLTGSWDRIPQFYSVDTKTPYIGRRRDADAR